MRTHFSSKKYSQQHSTLYMHMNHLEQRNTPAEKTFFHHLEKLVLHSFDTHVVVLFLTHISSQKDIKKTKTVKEYIQQLIFFCKRASFNSYDLLCTKILAQREKKRKEKKLQM